MDKLILLDLKGSTDPAGKYVDFGLVRDSISVNQLIEDERSLESLLDPSDKGEARGKCPQCETDRSFSLNLETSRFKCFASCGLKGGGVIDFVSKVYNLSAKESAHLVACAYRLTPYAETEKGEGPGPSEKRAEIGSNGHKVNISADELETLRTKAGKYDKIVGVVTS